MLTACLDAERTIERALRSVADCTYPNLEHIVVDGGSTDGTLGIVGRHAERLDRIISEPDRGISDAFNKGIRAATGELIGLVSSDDFLVPGILDRLASLSRSRPEVDVFYGDAICVEHDRVHVLPAGPDLGVLPRDFPVRHCAMWARRRAYRRYGDYSVSYQLAMDYEWVFRAHHLGARFAYVPEILGAFRIGGVNTRLRLRTMRESQRLQVAHGVGRWRARMTFLSKAARHCAKEVLPRVVTRPLLGASRRQRSMVAVEPAAWGINAYL